MTMNIAQIMIPKVCTVFLHQDNTIRQGLEIMLRHGYTAVPVLDQGDKYVGCVHLDVRRPLQSKPCQPGI